MWLCEHEPVFTQGVAGRDDHVLDAGAIPVVRTKRGGQVTYHGPGQVVAYPLVDLRRLRIYVKEYVYRLEQAVLEVLEQLRRHGPPRAGAPGIYVRLDDPFGHAALTGPGDAGDPFAGLGKVAALGIKVSRHCTYHGVALNVAMDLEPFCAHPPLRLCRAANGRPGYTGCRTDWAMWQQRLGARPRLVVRLSDQRMTSDNRSSTHGPDRYDATAKQKAQAKTARIPIKVVPAEVLKKPDWIRVKAGSPTRASTRSSRSCASTSCTRCARKPRARTSASASATARPPS